MSIKLLMAIDPKMHRGSHSESLRQLLTRFCQRRTGIHRILNPGSKKLLNWMVQYRQFQFYQCAVFYFTSNAAFIDNGERAVHLVFLIQDIEPFPHI